MKKTLIISIGVVVILLVAAAWVYLMIFGTPKEPVEVFSDLGFPTVDREISDNTPALPAATAEDLNALRQITNRPVAGFTFTADDSIVRFMEAGVGHIFDVNVINTEEVRVSGLTLPKANQAIFSPKTDKVVLQVTEADSTEYLIGTISNDSLMLTELPDGTHNPAFLPDGTLLYTEAKQSQTVGYQLPTASSTATEIFTIPLLDSRIVWTDTLDAIYTHSRISNLYRSALYKINNNILKSVTENTFGFTAHVYDTHIVYSETRADTGAQSYVLRAGDDFLQKLPILFIPEKCVYAGTDILWCAVPFNPSPTFSIDSWYKGITPAQDNIWRINLNEQSASLAVNLLTTSGRLIDVSNMRINNTGTSLLFTNKVDNTLWLYEIQ